MKIGPLLLFCFSFAANSISAGPLSEARINKIINEVSVVDPAAGPRKASLQEVIKDELGVKTGIKSRSELLFQDETLTRIGPESYFSFKAGTRDLSLQQGTMLLQVPKGLGGTRIRTAAVTASITGTTIMLENIPGKHLKVLVLEGSLRLSVNRTFGDTLLLLPGKMVIMPPNAKRIPDPVSVDLARVMKTSALVNMGEKPLPSVGLIQTEMKTQSKAERDNHLVDTNLVILGGGTNAVLASDNLLSALDRKDAVNDMIPVSRPIPAPTPAVIPTPRPIVNPPPTPSPTATPRPSPTATPPDSEDDGDQHHGAKHGAHDEHDEKNARASSASPGNSSLVESGRENVAGKNQPAIKITSSVQLLALISDAEPQADGLIKFKAGGQNPKTSEKAKAETEATAMPASAGNGRTRPKSATVHSQVFPAKNSAISPESAAAPLNEGRASGR